MYSVSYVFFESQEHRFPVWNPSNEELVWPKISQCYFDAIRKFADRPGDVPTVAGTADDVVRRPDRRGWGTVSWCGTVER